VSISDPFIKRPVGTSLLTIAIALAGVIAYRLLPVSPLPQVDFPTIQVSAGLPGASPETMASSVATPLERMFGRIAGVTEMTSTSYLGSTSITLQFDLSRNVDAAARDVQAAINAARGNLPANLPSNPTYRKVNPADAPIIIIALTSDIMDQARMYDVASSILQQKLSQVGGVGLVSVGGSALPGVRVELNPSVVNNYGISMDTLRTVLGQANADRPKGELSDGSRAMVISANDQIFKAKDYMPLIVAYQNGSPVRLSSLGQVTDSVEDLRNAGMANGKPSVLLVVFRQPGANIIDAVDNVYAVLPQLQASIPAAIHLDVMVDRTTTIRASIKDVEKTLLISIALVILVVFAFLRNPVATLIPSVVVPVSLLGTFGIMYLAGYSLDNLSLMALTISTGFVVDDAIVVIENVSRYLEKGLSPVEAAHQGSAEIGFTVVSMSTSLVAVFIPILMMTGIVGRLFREFAVTLSVAIGVSMIVSLTTTPMMCAKFLRRESEEGHGRLYQWSEKWFEWMLETYAAGLRFVLAHQPATLLTVFLAVSLNVFLFWLVPKGFFPQQDTGRMMGAIQAEQDISFQAMKQKLVRFTDTVSVDHAVANAVAFCGGSGGTNTGRMFVQLKDLDKGRKSTVDQVIARIRKETADVPGARLYLQAVQDIRIGGRSSNALYQYTLQSADLETLKTWAPRVMERMRKLKQIVDLNTDQQNNGLESWLTIDRDAASELGLTAQNIDDALYDAFGQRQVSTMYAPMNQYHVVMEVAPQYWQNPDTLKNLYARTPKGQEVPLAAFTKLASRTTPLVVNHQGFFPSVTLSFNLPEGVSLGQAVDAIEAAERQMHMPASVLGSFSGTAQAFQASLSNEPVLIATALIAVYIVLGMLYESYIHPITILSTLPSAGVGALLALLLTKNDLSVIALIGIILLIGIVKKNAIMMIDFALEAQRREGRSAHDAIYEACLLRFRPITMTTMAAMLGAFPLAFGTGTGSELRRPLGIAIVGGLIVSQMLTLFTTPIVYLYMESFKQWLTRVIPRSHSRSEEALGGTGQEAYG
jgi:multidrug efflux pump